MNKYSDFAGHNESFKRRNPQLSAPGTTATLDALSVETAALLVPTSDEGKLNKTERAYLAYIRCLGFAWIGVQNVTLKLAHDTRYTPDFVTLDRNGHLDCREVKGFMRDDAAVKIKVAARLFPWITFQIVRKTKFGFEHVVVKP